MKAGDRPLFVGTDLTGDVPVRKVIRLRDVLPTQPTELPNLISCDRCGGRFSPEVMKIKGNARSGELGYLRLCSACQDLYPRTVREEDAVPHDWDQVVPRPEPVDVESLQVHMPGTSRALADMYWEVDDERPEGVVTKFCQWEACDRQPLSWGQVGEFIPDSPNQIYCCGLHREHAQRLRRYGLMPGEFSNWIEQRRVKNQEPEPEPPTIHTGSSPEELHAWAVSEYERKFGKERQDYEQADREPEEISRATEDASREDRPGVDAGGD